MAVILGAGACDQFAASPAGMAPDGGGAPDLSRPWQPPPGDQKGEAVITAKSAPLGKISEGGRYELAFLVDTISLYDDVYRFSLTAIDVTGSSIGAWNSGCVLPVAESWVELGKPLLVKATFTVPAGARSAKLVFRADSLGGIGGNAFPQQIVIGEVADIADPRATATLHASALPPGLRDAKLTIDGTAVAGVQVPFGSQGNIAARLQIDATSPGAAGDFRLSAAIEGSPGDWTATSAPDHLEGVPAGADRAISVKLENKRASGQPTISYLVVRADHLPSPGATNPDYRSWARIPIQGYTP